MLIQYPKRRRLKIISDGISPGHLLSPDSVINSSSRPFVIPAHRSLFEERSPVRLIRVVVCRRSKMISFKQFSLLILLNLARASVSGEYIHMLFIECDWFVLLIEETIFPKDKIFTLRFGSVRNLERWNNLCCRI